MVKKSNEQSIKDFIKKHGNKYDYSLVDYVNAIEKVKIICEKHGIFEITPNSHLNGAGCYKCGRDVSDKSRIKPNEEFLKKCILVHGDRYDYSKTIYNKFLGKVTITCKKHGDFTQEARKHLEGNGCKKCSNENLYVDFVDLCKEKYPQYNYDKVEYNGMFNYVTITCDKHGDFSIKPVYFYHVGRGCKKCLVKTKSQQEVKWLDMIGIPEENRNVYLHVGDKRYCVDAYIPETNTIYEYNGDFFHGNPKVHKMDEINPLLKETYGELYSKTIQKENLIKQNGYNLISIWESDFSEIIKNNKKI